jgi:FkbM family methyltransferase
MSKQYINTHSRSGIIHVGAHVGQERDEYRKLGKEVLWIEPDPDTYEKLKNNIKSLPGQRSMCALILDEEKDVKFNVSRQSDRSSVYEFTNHHFNDSKFEHTKTITLPSIRLDSINLDNYDTLITDTQGADLNVIKSLGDEIINFNLIICEVFLKECYKNIPLAPEYDEYLCARGFERIAKFGWEGNTKWSNYVYVKTPRPAHTGRPIHTYNNGVKCYRTTIYPEARARYEKYINLHEPFEEVVFDHVIKNYDIKTFVDVGSAWGYYSILAKNLSKDVSVIGFDPDKEMIENAYENTKLNDITDIEFRTGKVPNDFKLSDIIDEVEQIDLIKIDIQGAGTVALESAGVDIIKIKNIILGTHDSEHNDCLELLKRHGFEIKLNLEANEIPIQPDGLLWASRG